MKFYAVVLIAIFAFLSIVSVGASPLPSAEPQVVSKTKAKTKHYTHRTKRGGKWIYAKSAKKTRPVRHKTWRTGRKVVSRTKKIVS